MSRWGKGIVAFLLILSFVSLVTATILKFRYGLHNALDLAIFNQVFWQTIHGNLFGMTIHPHSYLGDHFELFLLLLTPFYALIPRPETLLVLQALAIALTPIPLVLLASEPSKQSRCRTNLIILGVFFWIINPYLHSAVLFEFHSILFAAPLLTTAYWAYRKNRFRTYVTMLFLLLTLREDLALTVMGFSLMALIERRLLLWWAPSFVVALGWFFGATAISSQLNPNGHYKFLDLYSWMGKDIISILTTIFLRPIETIRHAFPLESLRVFGLAFSSFLFIPALVPRVLLIGLPSVLIIALTQTGLTTAFLITHYQIILLVTLLIAFFESIPLLERIWNHISPRVLRLLTIVILSLLMGLVLMQVSMHSPFFTKEAMGNNLYRFPQRSPWIRNTFLDELRDVDRVLVGSNFLADFGDRETLMAFHYAYIGKKQFSNEDFPLPEIDAALFDAEEILRLIVIKDIYPWAKEGIENGSKRLQAYLEREQLHPARTIDDTILYTKTGTLNPFSILSSSTSVSALEDATLTLCEKRLCLKAKTAHPSGGENILLRFSIENQNAERVWQSFYLPAYGIFMPHDLQESSSITTDWTLTLPQLETGVYHAQVTLEPIEGFHIISKLRHAVFISKRDPTVLDEMILGSFTIDENGSLVEVEKDDAKTESSSE